LSLEPPSAEGTAGSLDSVALAPATAPAYALVGADGGVVAADAVFRRQVGVAVIATPELASAVGAVTVANQPLVALALDTPSGRALPTRVEAVMSAQDQRLALIEVQITAPPPGADALARWFPAFADDSAAIVWLKDLEGRYRWVNRQYTEELGVDADWVIGRLDSELGQLEAIDGPRLRAGARSALAPETPRAEPLSLEYTIPGFDRRPAYAALRFPLTDPAGSPSAVCGVASPAEHPEIAQAECAQLLEVAAWFRGDAAALRQATIERWAIRAVRLQGSAAVTAPAPATVSVAAPVAPAVTTVTASPPGEDVRAGLEERIHKLQAQVDHERARVADLETALAEARGHADALAGSLEVANRRAAYIDTLIERTRELEAMVASASAAGVAASRSAERVIELQGEVQALNGALEEARERARAAAAADAGSAALDAERARHAAEVATLREESQALKDDLESLRGQLEHAEARHREELSAHQRHEGELSDIQDRVQTELNAANQRHRMEISQLRDRYDALAAEHGQLIESEHQARADAEALRDQLSAALAQLRELQSARAASRDQIARLERAVAAAAATATPPPGPAAIASRPATPDPQLGWDAAAQQALVRALSGCLNFRSILSEAVRLIGLGGGWDAVVAWLPDTRAATLSCAATWVRSPVEMARLETSMWQVRQSPSASAVGAAAASGEIVWLAPPAAGGDPHLAPPAAGGAPHLAPPAAGGDRHLTALEAEGIHTVVLVPVRQQGQTSAVLELCSAATVAASPEADAALRSIEVEVAAANQRLVDAANAGQWGRRRR
jgi:predicted  nucleic acid-binding Zn-ribbon protein/PAS domain-containing protein